MSRSAGVRPMQTSESVRVVLEAAAGWRRHASQPSVAARPVADPVARAGAERGRRGRAGWRAGSGRARGSRSRCTRSGRAAGAAARRCARRCGPLQLVVRRAQSRRVGARSGGSLASSSPISSSVRPTFWAKTMNAMRRRTGARVAAVAGARALGRDEALVLVEAQGAGRDAAAPGDLADGDQLGHLTSSLVELVACLRCPEATLEAVMADERASERIMREVTSWPGVEAGPGSRGEFAFTVAGRRSATSTATAPPLRLPPRRRRGAARGGPGRPAPGEPVLDEDGRAGDRGRRRRRRRDRADAAELRPGGGLGERTRRGRRAPRDPAPAPARPSPRSARRARRGVEDLVVVLEPEPRPGRTAGGACSAARTRSARPPARASSTASPMRCSVNWTDGL